MEKVSQSKSEGNYIWKGLSWSYNDALDFQKKIVDSYKSAPTFIASIHAPVFSVGKSMNIDQDKINNIPIVPVERGGKAMFHGPGQLTIYPILRLADYFKGPKDYVCFLFCSLKEYFKSEHNINLVSHDNGLWTTNSDDKPLKKVGFIGLRIKRGVAHHGFSLNYNSKLENFEVLSPCNISGTQVGNLFNDQELDLKAEADKIYNFMISKLKPRS